MSRLANRSKANNNGRNILIGLFAFLLILLAGYAYRSTHYSNRFLPNTFIEDTNVSNLTLAEANEKIQESFSAAEFTLTENEQAWKTINKKEFGLQTDFSADLEKIQSEQNQWLWGLSFVTGRNNYSLSQTAFDEELLSQQTESLKDSITELNADREATKNASITTTETGFSIVPETQGNELDVTQILETLKADLLAGKDTLELEDFQKKPTVTSEDETLKQQLTEMNNIAQVTATYQINGNTFQIPQEKIVSWLVFADGKVTLDREQVLAYVTSLGEQFNTSTNSSEFESTRRGTVTVPAGSLSWTIAPESETDALMEAILAGKDFTRSPISQGVTDAGSPLFGNTFIEVDLVNQHMWFYREGELVLETDIVSGHPDSATPAGVFYVWNKERNAKLRGTNRLGVDYETPVDYWLPIDWTGVGIHDSPWQSAYGGDRWLTNGSNGCINTPPSVMSKLFEEVEIGTPVIVF